MPQTVLDRPTIVENKKEATRLPPDYVVLLLNDDFTPMDFVVQVLCGIFHHSEEKAVQLMMDVHQKGKATVGQYRKDIAETKQFQVMDYAAHFGHPLKCVIEPLAN
jgi:ATP-dependent Clp protease adaptor protein ClpS